MCSCAVSILHIYTAKGLRECAFAAAERLRDVGRLDAKEHKGKVFKNCTFKKKKFNRKYRCRVINS